MKDDEVEYEFKGVASDGMAQLLADIFGDGPGCGCGLADDIETDAREKDREWRKREAEVDQLLGIMASGASRPEKRDALQSYLDQAAGENGGVVAVDRYRLTMDNLVDVFSSGKIDHDWKRNRLIFRNCRDCRAIKSVVFGGMAKIHGAEGCCWKSWFPLEYCDVIRRWPWRWHSSDEDNDLIPQMIMAEDQGQYDVLKSDFLENTEAKFLFHLLENGLAGTDDAFMEQRFAYVGKDRLDGIMNKFGRAMVLALAYNLGRRAGESMRCGSNDPLYGLMQIEKFRPGIVASARDRFGNDAQLYLLAGYGSAAAPCDNGHDIFDTDDLVDERNALKELGCSGGEKNEFGLSACALM